MVTTVQLFRILLCVFCFVGCYSYVFKKTALVSRKLCNNDHSHSVTFKCYNETYEGEVGCDSRIIAKDSCSEVKLTGDLSTKFIQELSAFVDFDATVRRITLHVASSKADNLTLLDGLVDSFLLPRPMWSVTQEPLNVTDSLMYVFERYNQLWDSFFQHIADIQFPDAKVCSTTPMLVGHGDCIHPGYSDIRKGYYAGFIQAPMRMGAFVPEEIDSKNRTHSAFISKADCPAEHLNKWTCAFLPMTNCTLPIAAENSSTTALVLYHPTSQGGGSILAALIRNPENEKQYPVTKEMKATIQFMNSLTPFVYKAPFNGTKKMLQFHGPDPHQVAEFLLMDLLFRKTAFYRRKVAEILNGFRTKYNLGDTIRTDDRRFVAVHVRRSDRLLRRINMTDFCIHLLKQRSTGIPQNCTYADGVVKPCHGNENVLGCNEPGDVPFGAITLDSVVEAAERLVGPEIRNMIVLSEDLGWVDREIERVSKLQPHWRFYSLDQPKDISPSDGFVDKTGVTRFSTRNGGTAAGALFQATVALVQECEALLGHFNSGVPVTLAGAMCHHHAGLEGVCPPVYNLKMPLQ